MGSPVLLLLVLAFKSSSGGSLGDSVPKVAFPKMGGLSTLAEAIIPYTLGSRSPPKIYFHDHAATGEFLLPLHT